MRVHLFFTFIMLSVGVFAQNNYVQYVHPMIGTGGHGHTFPGATNPFAMVQLSPDSRIDGSWDGCSGYHYSDSIIYGFSHTHLSGTGCSDYGDISFMPVLVKNSQTSVQNQDTLSSKFSHQNEVSEAGYYAVKLENGVSVALSSSPRVGIQEYSINTDGYLWITLNLKHRDELLEGRIFTVDKHSFCGFRRSKAWAQDQTVYYYFEVSRDADQILISKNEHGETKINLGYAVQKGATILVKTALSTVDEDGARSNLQKEMPDWNFNKVRQEAKAAWNKELNRIKVFGGTQDEKINFYTALYHCMIHPNILNDFDGRYRGRDGQIHRADGFNYYTVFSLWDTYRALHPLLNIIDKDRSRDFVLTFKAQFEQSGRLPMWELWDNETNCMIGFHSVSVIWDAFNKHVIGSETLNALYTAVKTEAMSTRFGLSSFRKNSLLAIEDESESVSKTLEYSYDMYCVANIAYATHHDEDAKYFSKLANSWQNVYDVKTGFMRPRKNGGWLNPFDPKQVNNHYTEANAWQYSFAIPQAYQSVYDINKISELFNVDSKTTGREQSDISGLIGQYAHGNEPSHHIPYLFNNLDSTSKYVKQICNTLYKPTPDGLCGNEDCGQMSAWYVFSAMGFYPVNPSSTEMVFGNMLFDSVIFANGDAYSTIYKNRAEAKNPKHGYAKSNRFQLMDGWGKYDFGYSSTYSIPSMPVSLSVSTPIIVSASEVFKNKMSLTMYSNNLNSSTPGIKNGGIYYTLDSTIPNRNSIKYIENTPIEISANTMVKAIFISDSGAASAIATAQLYKMPHDYSIKIKSVYNKQYTADGDEGLIDGLIGSTDWRKGRWQGYQSQDFEAVIDLKQPTEIKKIEAGFLQDSRSWILFPKQVKFYGSTDGINFKLLYTMGNTVTASYYNVLRAPFGFWSGEYGTYQFIKVVAENYGVLPSWHQGAGGDAFIFIDEIRIN